MSFPAIQLAELGRQPTYMLARILRILNSSPTIRLFALRVWIYELRSQTYRFDFSIQNCVSQCCVPELHARGDGGGVYN